MEHLQIWSKALSEIRPQMTELTYGNWIATITPLLFKEGTLILEVPSNDILQTLKDFYYDTILSAVRKANPQVQDIILILPKDRDIYVSPAQEGEEWNGDITLNPKYTFDSFIVGGANQFAHAAAQAVAQNPGSAYNPLFIYGGVGLGKTHLMHAIGHYVLQHNKDAKVIYVTSETFTNELISAIQQDKREEFRNRYRKVDLLMIDDVQFISRSQATQEEFFNTFNTLYNASKQIIISSDCPPKEIPKLEERLSSRFQQGLITDIQPPDLETRIAILKNRANVEGIEVGDDVLAFIANHVQSNIRELEGCLTKVKSYSRLLGRPINMSTTMEALKDLIPEVTKREVTPQVIRTTVAAHYGVSTDSMDSARRDREVVMPRQVAMYLCHTMLSLPYKKISYLFGRNDHTTAMSACDKIEKMLQTDASFRQELDAIKKELS